MGWAMDWVHRGGPWTGSMGWSMDPGPCFVYVPLFRTKNLKTIHPVFDNTLYLSPCLGQRRKQTLPLLHNFEVFYWQLQFNDFFKNDFLNTIF